MKMIRHQAKRIHLPAGFVAGLAQRAEEALPILIIPENRFPPVPAIHHMINRPAIFNAEFASLRAMPAKSAPQPGYVPISRTDPFLCQYQELTRLRLSFMRRCKRALSFGAP